MSAQTACTRIQHASVLLLATAFSLVTMLVGSEHHDSIMDRYSLLLEANALHNLEKIVAMQGAWNSQENFKIRGKPDAMEHVHIHTEYSKKVCTQVHQRFKAQGDPDQGGSRLALAHSKCGSTRRTANWY